MSDITTTIGAPALRILIPGGQGHLGQLLARHLSALGHTVTTLTRRPAQSNSRATWKQLYWDGRTLGPWTDALEQTDVLINLAGLQPLPNIEFLSALRNAWGMRIGLPAPAWMLATGAFFLDTETELLLKSRRVVPAMLLDHGFTFRFPDWPSAAEHLVERVRAHRPRIEIPNTLFRAGSRELKTEN